MSQVDNPELSSRFQNKLRQNAEDQKEYSSVAQYLMGRAHQETFFVEIGEMEIEVRVPTEGDILNLIKLQASVVKSAKGGYDNEDEALSGIEFIGEAYDQIYGLLARLCVDDGLDYQFFSSGLISSADIGSIISGILEQKSVKQEKVSRFRKK